MAEAELVVRSDEEAFQWLEKYLAGEVSEGELKLEQWPVLSVRLTGDKFDQSLTPGVMKAFIELQTAINRSYALERYGEANAGRLSPEEKGELEIKVKVDKGSTLLEVNFQEVITKMGLKAVANMEPTYLVATTVAIGLIWAGKAVWTHYLDSRKDVRMQEVRTEAERENLAAMQFMSQEETKRMEILSKMVERQPALESVARHADDARAELLKGFSRAEKMEVSGTTLDKDIAEELATNARRQSHEVRMDGLYRILRNDTTDPNAFRVRVREHKGEQEFEARVQNESLSQNYRELLQTAEWNRTLVRLSINAKSLEGDIRGAVVIGVYPPDNE